MNSIMKIIEILKLAKYMDFSKEGNKGRDDVNV